MNAAATHAAHAAAPASAQAAHSPPRQKAQLPHGHLGPSLQARVRIGAADDPLEREADRIAEAVTAGRPASSVASGAPAVLRRKCAECEKEEKQTIQRKCAACERDNVASTSAEAAARSVAQGGSRLPADMRAYFEPRFGRSFADVRIHDGAAAGAAARGIHARAFTLGSSIAFAAGQYAPRTPAGRRLIAHELAHVAQQARSPAPVIRRAEVDDRPSVCAPLTDIETDIDAKVNAELTAARSAIGVGTSTTPPSAEDKVALLQEVGSELGSLINPISPIERFIDSLPKKKRFIPPASLKGTKFEGASAVDPFYKFHAAGVFRVIGTTVKVHGICIGSDKLGHFFQQGLDYADIFATAVGSGRTPAEASAEAQSTGRFGEINKFGLASTSVFSNADLAANLAGLRFYDDLWRNPTGLTFRIAAYIADDWNEQKNPSFYASGLATVVWANLLTGAWDGFFNDGSGTANTPIKADLATIPGGPVTGTYVFGSTPTPGKIRNGTIAQIATPVAGFRGSLASATPVSGIQIDFEWEQGALKGKGQWISIGEQKLVGTWGSNASETDGGEWVMTKA